MTRSVTFSLAVRPSPGGLCVGPMALTRQGADTTTRDTTTSFDAAAQLV